MVASTRDNTVTMKNSKRKVIAITISHTSSIPFCKFTFIELLFLAKSLANC